MVKIVHGGSETEVKIPVASEEQRIALQKEKKRRIAELKEAGMT